MKTKNDSKNNKKKNEEKDYLESIGESPKTTRKANTLGTVWKMAEVHIYGKTLLMCKPHGDIVKGFNDPDESAKPKRNWVFKDKELINKIHFIDMEKGIVGFPTRGFKIAISIAAKYLKGIHKTDINRLVQTWEDYLFRIHYESAITNESIGNIKSNGKSVPILIRRPQFNNWSATIKILYDPLVLTENLIVSLIEKAGVSVGLGSDRPEHGGTHGMFLIRKMVPMPYKNIAELVKAS